MKYTISYQVPVLPQRIVMDYLDSNNIEFQYGTRGEIELQTSLCEQKISEMEHFFIHYGIEIIRDEKVFLAQRIKDVLAEIAYDDKRLKKTSSCHLADHMGFSYAYLAGSFERSTSYTIEKYLIMIKVERAKRLIVEGELTIKEISMLMNYSSAGHMCKQFKKTTGLSVTSFRRIIDYKRNRVVRL
ncbi:helix-turn-helix domain-containing protein [Flavobacterium selenitireducens]|uniref:helix-turn-helix domain-containing protein n=1 Tax=Flavobacterium selenitireducens TaxID=2722704 RepID=UPI00168BED65|nr:AraC family transcriptional regulator [Flavobacterium selenitireducens]MBD3583071.1 helix-turn-helix transcriptional regulator [Flavobacterium selenitireducens]